MKKIQFLFTGNFELNGRDSHFLKGELTEANDADAARLINGLCAREYFDHPELEMVEEPKKPRKTKKAGE